MYYPIKLEPKTIHKFAPTRNWTSKLATKATLSTTKSSELSRTATAIQCWPKVSVAQKRQKSYAKSCQVS